jgi:Mn-dependent DtxR family transcriptional regulator
MSKKQVFIDFINELMNAAKCDWNSDAVPEDARVYWEALCNKEEKEKPMFTDNGKLILQYLQDNADTASWKSRDIAEGLFISSRTVSGAIRKLVTDGFVEKLGQDPVIYAITEKGKNIEII